MFNILIIDDDEEIMELIEIYLVNDGYKVYKANTGEKGLDLIRKNEIHLAILDIMMPGINGLEVCMKIRCDYNMPIIMVSAKSQHIDKIQGLSTGADDYMSKPFNPMELLARVKSQIRRYIYLNDTKKNDRNIEVVQAKGISINKSNRKVTLLGKEIKLTPTEYEIILLLASEFGRVFSTEEIFKIIWKEKYFQGNNTVMVHIWRLREKIEENPKDPKIIETIWGVGYKIG